MKKVKTHWEARWQRYPSQHSTSELQKSTFTTEHECRAFAIAQALENGETNRGDSYTQVEVVEVETHEEKLDTYSRDVVKKMLTPVRIAQGPNDA